MVWVPDPLMEHQSEPLSADGNQWPQRYIVNSPFSVGRPRYGGNDQLQQSHETMSYYTPQAVHNQMLVMRPLHPPAPARLTEFLPELEGTTQTELPVPRVPHLTYTQQSNFVPSTSNAIPDILHSDYHQVFDAGSQPQPRHFVLPESQLEVFEQRIRTIFSEVEAGVLVSMADRLTDSLQHLQAHIEDLGR